MKKVLFTAVAMLGLTSATHAQVPNYVPTNGLVGWWPFNGNANDESGNGNNGVVNGATLTEDRLGNPNMSFEFNGDDQILVEPWNQITGANPFSLNFWVLPADNYVGWILSFGNSENGEGFECGNWNWGGGNVFGAQIWVYGYYPEFLTTLNSFEWSNITIIYDGFNLICYKNGVYTAQHAVDYITVNLLEGQLSIGKQLSFEEYFIGKIDDIGIWNRALSQEEITALYNAETCANNTSISPQINSIPTGSTATFTASTSDPNPSYIWQSDLGQGFQTLSDLGNYSGTSTATLSLTNVQLSEHNQPIRVISTSGECIDTSEVAVISILDTCITTIFDTSFVSVTDTLIINTLITGINTPDASNTIKVFPNPANTYITIDYGNFALMNGYELRIENSLGQQVFQTNITQQSDFLSLATWGGNGLYFVHIVDPQGNTVDIRKIVLQ